MHAHLPIQAPDIKRLEKATAERGKKIDALTARINEATDVVFAAFSKRCGVANIREYEEQVMYNIIRQRLSYRCIYLSIPNVLLEAALGRLSVLSKRWLVGGITP